MPMVGTRRSTRVFVPKSVPAMAAEDQPVALVLRSGKRLVLSKPVGKKVEAAGYGSLEWQRLFGNSGDAAAESNTSDRWWRGERGGKEGTDGQEEVAEGADRSDDRCDTSTDMTEAGAPSAHEEEVSSSLARKTKKFKVAYRRKRKRHTYADMPSSSVSLDDQKEEREWRYGITYERMRLKKPSRRSQLPLSAEEVVSGKAEYSTVGENCLRTGGTALAVKEEELLDTVDAALILKEERELVDTTDAAALLKPEDLLLPTATVGAQGVRLDTIDCTKKTFAGRAIVRESDLWDGLTGLAVLLLLVDSSRGTSALDVFTRLLLSVLTGMRRIEMELSVFTRSLLCKSFTPVFAQHGVHFLALRKQGELASALAISGAGMCRINDGSLFPIPSLTINFSALPFYFKHLHLDMFLSSRFFPRTHPSPLDPEISSSQVVTTSPSPLLEDNVADKTDKTNPSIGATTVSGSVPALKDQALLSSFDSKWFKDP